MKMISIETKAYNHRRYGKPWMAEVTFNDPKNGEWRWGYFTANDGPGSRGLLELSVNEGDIVARGQKDHRGNNTAVEWFVVDGAGALQPLSGRVEALKLWRSGSQLKRDESPACVGHEYTI